MTEIEKEPEINLEEIEFREITTAEYIAQLEDDKMRMVIKSQIAPMSFAMKQPNNLSPKKLGMLPWGTFSKLLAKFNKAQGLEADFLGKK